MTTNEKCSNNTMKENGQDHQEDSSMNKSDYQELMTE